MPSSYKVADKFLAIQDVLTDWSTRKCCTRKELQSLIGRLHHACLVVWPGRTFLHRMINLLSCFRNDSHPIRLNFCYMSGRLSSLGSPCPADEWTLCLFVTHLADSLRYSSIKVYLSAVRSLHVDQGFTDPLENCLQLQRVIRGIKRSQGHCLPIHVYQSPATFSVLFILLWTSICLTMLCFGHLVLWLTLVF